jgi:peptidoglycan hydrolase CwlO-like protein
MTYAAITGSDITVAQGLENEVQALKLKCDVLEKTVNELQKTVKDLQSVSGTHQSLIETLRQHIVKFEYREETLDRGYQGEEYELIQ